MYAAPPHDREETRGCTTRQGPHPVALSPTHEGRSEPPPPASGLRTFSLVSLHTASPSHACTNSPAAVCARERDENVESESAGACEQPRARPRERTDDGVWRAVIVAAAATEAAATAAKAAAAAAEAASWAARGATEGAPAAGRAPPAAEAPPGAPSGAACWWPHASGEDTRLVTCCHVAPRGSKPQPRPRRDSASPPRTCALTQHARHGSGRRVRRRRAGRRAEAAGGHAAPLRAHLRGGPAHRGAGPHRTVNKTHTAVRLRLRCVRGAGWRRRHWLQCRRWRLRRTSPSWRRRASQQRRLRQQRLFPALTRGLAGADGHLRCRCAVLLTLFPGNGHRRFSLHRPSPSARHVLC